MFTLEDIIAEYNDEFDIPFDDVWVPRDIDKDAPTLKEYLFNNFQKVYDRRGNFIGFARK